MIDFLVYKDLSRGKSIHVLHEFFDPLPRSLEHCRERTGHSRRNGWHCTIDVFRNPILVGFSRRGKRCVLEFAGPNAGASASVLLLNTPDFWANDGNGPSRQTARKRNTSILPMVPRILLASTPCEPRADGPNPPE